MKKYFAFDGENLTEIGEFESVSQALEAADEKEIEHFYVTSLDEWKIFAGKVLQIEEKNEIVHKKEKHRFIIERIERRQQDFEVEAETYEEAEELALEMCNNHDFSQNSLMSAGEEIIYYNVTR